VVREGRDVTLVGTGQMVAQCKTAAEALAGNGIDAEVINMSTIKPLDKATLRMSLQKTGCVVTAEEHSVIGGLGAAVAEFASQEAPVPLEMVGTRDTFGESGTPDQLFEKYGLTPKDVEEAARKAIGRKKELNG